MITNIYHNILEKIIKIHCDECMFYDKHKNIIYILINNIVFNKLMIIKGKKGVYYEIEGVFRLELIKASISMLLIFNEVKFDLFIL